MTAGSIWLIKIILAHLITDFILQPKNWVDQRIAKHFASPLLYLHGVITALLAFAITGFQNWMVAMVILVTHILIDGWKSYRKQTTLYFLMDQLLHLLVLMGCWYAVFLSGEHLIELIKQISVNPLLWKTCTAFVFITTPAGILIGQLTKEWRNKLPEPEGLANAGKWIGILERIIIFIFVLCNQYPAIALLVAAKGIIRFNEKDRQEIKTEYLVIGTLMSICVAIVAAQLVK